MNGSGPAASSQPYPCSITPDPDLQEMTNFLSVTLKEIRDTHLYDIHPFLKDDPVNHELSESIKLSGILHPPIILQDSHGNYDVICGRQRLKCAQTALQQSECFCRVLPLESNVENLLTILLEDQFFHCDLTIIEQSYFVDLCRKLIPEKTSLKSFIKSLPPGRITSGLHFLLPIVCMEISLQKQIHLSVVSEKIVGELQKYNRQDQTTLTDLIEKLQLGVNNQKKLLQFISEILLRNELPLPSLLAEDSLNEILNHPEMNNPQKTTQIFSILYRMCFPLLSSAEKSFQKEVDGLHLPNQCHLKATKSFENDEITLSIQFKDMSSFKRAWPSIAKDLT